MTYEITTSHVCPPIPDRSHDWQAIVSDYEDDSPVGQADNEMSALVDLASRLAQEADPALADVLEKIRDLSVAEAEAKGRSRDYVFGLRNGFNAAIGCL